MGVFDDERRPPRARDLCLALDLPLIPQARRRHPGEAQTPDQLGFLDEIEPGLFAQPRPHAPTAPADQRS
ncbi:hypothetical protein [Streptomyces hygroscopicus]|uniref:hypothetical protein n=1 Tax=Streptomyces sp. KHY 26 TaxID=3097359 RepID=UPI00255612DA|nr:hypothetical protein [Streptomyces hygroscopicus]